MATDETKWECPLRDLNGFPTLESTTWPSSPLIHSGFSKSNCQTIKLLSRDPETRSGFPLASDPQARLVTHPLWPIFILLYLRGVQCIQLVFYFQPYLEI
jgi:hypothetical protein